MAVLRSAAPPPAAGLTTTCERQSLLEARLPEEGPGGSGSSGSSSDGFEAHGMRDAAESASRARPLALSRPHDATSVASGAHADADAQPPALHLAVCFRATVFISVRAVAQCDQRRDLMWSVAQYTAINIEPQLSETPRCGHYSQCFYYCTLNRGFLTVRASPFSAGGQGGRHRQAAGFERGGHAGGRRCKAMPALLLP